MSTFDYSRLYKPKATTVDAIVNNNGSDITDLIWPSLRKRDVVIEQMLLNPLLGGKILTPEQEERADKPESTTSRSLERQSVEVENLITSIVDLPQVILTIPKIIKAGGGWSGLRNLLVKKGERDPELYSEEALGLDDKKWWEFLTKERDLPTYNRTFRTTEEEYARGPLLQEEMQALVRAYIGDRRRTKLAKDIAGREKLKDVAYYKTDEQVEYLEKLKAEWNEKYPETTIEEGLGPMLLKDSLRNAVWDLKLNGRDEALDEIEKQRKLLRENPAEALKTRNDYVFLQEEIALQRLRIISYTMPIFDRKNIATEEERRWIRREIEKMAIMEEHAGNQEATGLIDGTTKLGFAIRLFFADQGPRYMAVLSQVNRFLNESDEASIGARPGLRGEGIDIKQRNRPKKMPSQGKPPMSGRAMAAWSVATAIGRQEALSTYADIIANELRVPVLEGSGYEVSENEKKVLNPLSGKSYDFVKEDSDLTYDGRKVLGYATAYMPQTIAKPASILVGVGEAALERLSYKLGIGKALGMSVGGIRKLVLSALVKRSKAQKSELNAIIIDGALGYLKNVGVELTTEGLQEIQASINKSFRENLSNRISNTEYAHHPLGKVIKEDIIKTFAETVNQAAIGIATLSAPGSILNTTAEAVVYKSDSGTANRSGSGGQELIELLEEIGEESLDPGTIISTLEKENNDSGESNTIVLKGVIESAEVIVDQKIKDYKGQEGTQRLYDKLVSLKQLLTEAKQELSREGGANNSQAIEKIKQILPAIGVGVKTDTAEGYSTVEGIINVLLEGTAGQFKVAINKAVNIFSRGTKIGKAKRFLSIKGKRFKGVRAGAVMQLKQLRQSHIEPKPEHVLNWDFQAFSTAADITNSPPVFQDAAKVQQLHVQRGLANKRIADLDKDLEDNPVETATSEYGKHVTRLKDEAQAAIDKIDQQLDEIALADKDTVLYEVPGNKKAPKVTITRELKGKKQDDKTGNLSEEAMLWHVRVETGDKETSKGLVYTTLEEALASLNGYSPINAVTGENTSAALLTGYTGYKPVGYDLSTTEGTVKSVALPTEELGLGRLPVEALEKIRQSVLEIIDSLPITNRVLASRETDLPSEEARSPLREIPRAVRNLALSLIRNKEYTQADLERLGFIVPESSREEIQNNPIYVGTETANTFNEILDSPENQLFRNRMQEAIRREAVRHRTKYLKELGVSIADLDTGKTIYDVGQYTEEMKTFREEINYYLEENVKTLKRLRVKNARRKKAVEKFHKEAVKEIEKEWGSIRNFYIRRMQEQEFGTTEKLVEDYGEPATNDVGMNEVVDKKGILGDRFKGKIYVAHQSMLGGSQEISALWDSIGKLWSKKKSLAKGGFGASVIAGGFDLGARKFDYNVMVLNSDKTSVVFLKVKNFDSQHDPSIEGGVELNLKMEEGTTGLEVTGITAVKEVKTDKLKINNKWKLVNSGYAGFVVTNSVKRAQKIKDIDGADNDLFITEKKSLANKEKHRLQEDGVPEELITLKDHKVKESYYPPEEFPEHSSIVKTLVMERIRNKQIAEEIKLANLDASVDHTNNIEENISKHDQDAFINGDEHAGMPPSAVKETVFHGTAGTTDFTVFLAQNDLGFHWGSEEIAYGKAWGFEATGIWIQKNRRWQLELRKIEPQVINDKLVINAFANRFGPGLMEIDKAQKAVVKDRDKWKDSKISSLKDSRFVQQGWSKDDKLSDKVHNHTFDSQTFESEEHWIKSKQGQPKNKNIPMNHELDLFAHVQYMLNRFMPKKDVDGKTEPLGLDWLLDTKESERDGGEVSTMSSKGIFFVQSKELKDKLKKYLKNKNRNGFDKWFYYRGIDAPRWLLTGWEAARIKNSDKWGLFKTADVVNGVGDPDRVLPIMLAGGKTVAEINHAYFFANRKDDKVKAKRPLSNAPVNLDVFLHDNTVVNRKNSTITWKEGYEWGKENKGVSEDVAKAASAKLNNEVKRFKKAHPGTGIIAAKIRLENPLLLDDDVFGPGRIGSAINLVNQALVRDGKKEISAEERKRFVDEYQELALGRGKSGEPDLRQLNKLTRKFLGLLKARGYDGLKYPNKAEGIDWSYVTFDNAQSKKVAEENWYAPHVPSLMPVDPLTTDGTFLTREKPAEGEYNKIIVDGLLNRFPREEDRKRVVREVWDLLPPMGEAYFIVYTNKKEITGVQEDGQSYFGGLKLNNKIFSEVDVENKSFVSYQSPTYDEYGNVVSVAVQAHAKPLDIIEKEKLSLTEKQRLKGKSFKVYRMRRAAENAVEGKVAAEATRTNYDEYGKVKSRSPQEGNFGISQEAIETEAVGEAYVIKENVEVLVDMDTGSYRGAPETWKAGEAANKGLEVVNPYGVYDKIQSIEPQEVSNAAFGENETLSPQIALLSKYLYGGNYVPIGIKFKDGEIDFHETLKRIPSLDARKYVEAKIKLTAVKIKAEAKKIAGDDSLLTAEELEKLMLPFSEIEGFYVPEDWLKHKAATEELEEKGPSRVYPINSKILFYKAGRGKDVRVMREMFPELVQEEFGSRGNIIGYEPLATLSIKEAMDAYATTSLYVQEEMEATRKKRFKKTLEWHKKKARQIPTLDKGIRALSALQTGIYSYNRLTLEELRSIKDTLITPGWYEQRVKNSYVDQGRYVPSAEYDNRFKKELPEFKKITGESKRPRTIEGYKKLGLVGWLETLPGQALFHYMFKRSSPILRILFPAQGTSNVNLIRGKARKEIQKARERRGLKQKHYKEWEKDLNEVVTTLKVKRLNADEAFPWELRRGELMSLWMHMQSEDNIRHMISEGTQEKAGERITNSGGLATKALHAEETGVLVDEVYVIDVKTKGKTTEEIREARRQVLLKTVSKLRTEDIQELKAIQEYYAWEYNQLNTVYKKRTGRNLPRINNYFQIRTVKSQRFAEVDGSADVVSEDLEDILKNINNNELYLPENYIIDRSVAKGAIYLEDITQALTRSVEQTSVYVGLVQPLGDAYKMLQTHEMQIKNLYSPKVYKNIEKYYADILHEHQGTEWIEKVARYLRKNASRAFLSINWGVTLSQALSFPVASVYVSWDYLFKGMSGTFGSDRAQWDEFFKNWSGLYNERLEGKFDRDTGELLGLQKTHEVLSGQKGTAFLDKGMLPIKFVDKKAVLGVLIAGYHQAWDQINSGNITEDLLVNTGETRSMLKHITDNNLTIEKTRIAVRYAETVVERSQPMFGPEHRSHLSRGNEIQKTVTAFRGWQDALYGLIMREMFSLRRGESQSLERVAKTLLWGVVVGSIGIWAIQGLRTVLRNALLDDDKRPETIWNKLLDSSFGAVPWVREFWNAVDYWLTHPSGRLTVTGNGLAIQSAAEYIDIFSHLRWFMTAKSKNRKEYHAAEAVHQLWKSIVLIRGLPYVTTYTTERIKKEILKKR
jgi:disulfide oxidoreductase YuzD